MIENATYPFAGDSHEQAVAKIVKFLSPYRFHIDQFQAAVLFHNVPYFMVIVAFVGIMWYFFEKILTSPFPSIFFFLTLIPGFHIIYCLGGSEVITSLYIRIPKVPKDAPDRIRTLEEIADLIADGVIFVSRVLFFIYRTILLPNIIDDIAIVVGLVVLGLIFTVVDVIAITFSTILALLILPGILTRRFVYNFLLNNIGNPAIRE